VKYAVIPPSIRLQMLAYAIKRLKPNELPIKVDKSPHGRRRAKSRQQYANTTKAEQR
jgi:hypothetical protein